MPPSITALHHAPVEGSVTLCAAALACPVANVVIIAAALYLYVVAVELVQWHLRKKRKGRGRIGEEKEGKEKEGGGEE